LDELLEGSGDAEPDLRTEILRRTGGVPFFVVSFVQGLQSGEPTGGGADRDGARGGVPWEVAQSIRQRVAALPEGASEVLGVAAVLGRTIQPAVLNTVVERGEGAVLAALEAAGRVRLLEEAEEQSLQFAHDVIREMVEADLGAPRRTVLHRRIAQALEQGAGARPVEALAYHYARGDVPDKALLYLEQAGDQAQRQFAHASAEGYYREAIHRLDALSRAADAARVREKLVSTLFLASRATAALLELEQAVATYQAAGDREGVWRSLAQIGRMQAARGATEEGLARLQLVVPALEEAAPSRSAALLWAALAWLFVGASQPVASIAAGERAAHLARCLGDEAIMLDVEVRRGTALLGLGRLHEARQVMEAALPRVEAVGEPVVAIDLIFRILLQGSAIYQRQGEFDRCRQHIDRALIEADKTDIALDKQWGLARRGELLFLQGDWSAARACLERSVDLMPATGWWLMAPEALVHLARLHLAMGDWAAAVRYLEEEHLQRSAMWRPALRRLLAERDLEEGQAVTALARLTADDGDEDGREPVLLAWAHLELGDLGHAADLLARALARARAECDRLTLVSALRIQALACMRQQRWDDAQGSLEEGLALARAMPHPYAEARLLHVYGLLYAQKQELAPAHERLEAALAIFRRLGAPNHAEQVEQAITSLQCVPPHAAAPQPALRPCEGHELMAGSPAGKRLSRTERQAWALARLRTDGPLSPRSYAEALGVSVDTALRDLSDLTQRGDITAQGTTKDRRYCLNVDAG
jgi:tetratricopeptide (TPR) repeat protein